jgi:hypothetical protein
VPTQAQGTTNVAGAVGAQQAGTWNVNVDNAVPAVQNGAWTVGAQQVGTWGVNLSSPVIVDVSRTPAAGGGIYSVSLSGHFVNVL